MKKLNFLIVCLYLLSAAAVAQEVREIKVIGDADYPPFMFVSPTGEREGLIFDLWKLWEQKTGIKVRFLDAPWAQAQMKLLNGEADVIEAIFKTPERDKLYDFSEPYADVQASIFTHESIRGIHNYNSLLGFQIGVQDGDSCVEQLKANGVTNLVLFNSNNEAVAAAVSGKIKMLCMDRPTGEYYIYKMNAHESITHAFDLHEGGLRRAVRKGNAETLQLVEQGMSLISSAEMKELRDKWMGHRIRLSPYLTVVYGVILTLIVAGLALFLWVRALQTAVRLKTNELQQQKENLLESEERYRVMIEDTLVPNLLSENGRLTAPNRAALAMLGMTNPLQLIGLSIEDISPFRQPDGTPSAEKAEKMRKIAVKEGGHRFEWEFLRVDGSTLQAIIMASPIELRGKQYLYVIFLDITEIKTTEAALRAEITSLKNPKQLSSQVAPARGSLRRNQVSNVLYR